MKKFKLKGVLDGLRSSVSTPAKSEVEIEESLRSEHFQVCKTVRHGFPCQPTSVAYDPVQHILAVGTKSGSLRILGQPGVDVHCHHNMDVAVVQMLFLVNEGALVTVCSDDSLHLWNFRQKKPEIVHTLRFQRERITHCYLSFQSKWLYVGTERGNVHIVNIESFVLSGYVINWNKAIELSRKTHPGPVVHLSDCPIDSSKLLIGFESGALVLWDLKSKTAEHRYSAPEALRSVSWHHEGKQFMCSHTDGSITTWNIRAPQKPCNIMTPHAKMGKDGKPEPCKPIARVEWKSVRNSEPLVIFSGGMSYDRAGRTPCITVMTGKTTTVLEMEHNVVDFCVLCETPWPNDFQDPYAIVVLLQNDLVVIDLSSPGYPCFENPYPMDIHESPVTACQYYADCPTDLIPAFYSVGSKQKRSGFSEKGWPVSGGVWGTSSCSYPEIIVTGHADGSLKFWDASAVTLQVLYKLKTAKMFEKPRNKTLDGSEDDPFAIYLIHLDLESRIMCLAGATHCMLFKYSKQEVTCEVTVLEVSIVYEVYDDLDSPELDYPKPTLSVVAQQQQSGSIGSYSSNTSDSTKAESTTALKVRSGARKWSTGYQPDLVCLLTWMDNEHPGNITSVSVNYTYGLMAFGNESGLAIVDIIQKSCLLNLGTPDLYGSMDPYQRAPRSPRGKKPVPLEGSNPALCNDDGGKSPTSDQSVSPTSPSPVPPPRTRGRHSKSVNLYAIREGGSIDVESLDKNKKEVVPSGKPSFELVTEVSVDETASKTKEETDKLPPDVQLTPASPPAITDNVVKVKKHSSPLRTSSMPIVDVPEELKVEFRASLAEKSHSHEELKTDRTRASTGSIDIGPMKSHPALAPSLSSPGEQDSKSHDKSNDKESEHHGDHHHKHKLTIKKLTSKLKPKRRHRSGDPATVSDTENQKETSGEEGVFVDDVGRSDTDDAGTDDENLLSPSELQSPGVEDLPDGKPGFFRKVSKKMKRLMHYDDDEDEDKHLKKHRVTVVDLTEDNNNSRIHVHKMHTKDLLKELHSDKNDGASFSRSRSSSMSSLENVSKEAIQCLVFADSYTRKFDNFTCPCLWVGTSLGSVLVIVMNLPPAGDQRLTQPVIVSPSGTIFRLKGPILCMSFLDCNGILIPAISGQWKDMTKELKEDKSAKQSTSNRQGQPSTSTAQKPRISPSSSTEVTDRQFAIICSEKQARVMSLPSQTCPYKVKISESSFVVKAEVVTLRGDCVCLACYVANGHIMVYSLPSLKLLLDVDFLPLSDLRVARTFTFSNNGHALFMCSPTEVQKITYSAEICDNLSEMLGDLFLPCETPEAPKQGFFKNLFGSGPSALDREELFGESSGKGARGIATKLPGTAGMQQMQGQATGIAGEVSRTRMLLSERGEKLSGIEDSSARMASEAENFSSTAHQMMLKYKDRKWYQF